VSIDSGFVPTDSVTIRDTLAVLGRRWRVLFLLIILGVAGGVGYTHKKAIHYESVAQVHVVAVTANPFGPAPSGVVNSVSMPTEQKIATSAPIAAIAAKTIGGGITPQQALANLTVSVPATTQILDFDYRGPTPKVARAGAKAFEQAYLSSRKATTAAQVAKVKDTLSTELAKLVKRRGNLQAKMIATSDPTVRTTLSGEIQSLNPSISSTSNQLQSLNNINTAGATVVQAATLPTKPSGVSHKIIYIGGFIGGLALGLIAAFIIDATDDHLHGPKDLAALTGAPVLARVPLLRSAIPWRRHDLAAEGTSHPKVAEAYRLLVNRLVVLAAKDNISSVLVASPAQGEGRSSVAANLAATFVDLGFRVWLVSADLKPPQVHKLFAPDEASGLVSVVPMTEAAVLAPTAMNELTVGVGGESREPSSGGHLTLMASAERPRPVGRLLNPLVLARQIRQNQKLVDLTIIDAPALLDFADAVPLLPVVDGVIVVADAGTTRRSELIELAELLDGTHARVIGSVLNRDGARVVSRRARRARRRFGSEGRKTKGPQRRPGASSGSYVPPSYTAAPTASSEPGDRSGDRTEHEASGGSASEPASFIGWPDDMPVTGAKARETRGSS
jgi:Mrp family chromosome partitioning ATPase/capsular polysaccharide biosynthesis protein